MRRLFIYSTVIFWLAIVGFWLASLSHKPATPSANLPSAPVLKSFSLAEVMRHQQAGDCWMAIAGEVYDVTAYLPSHPSSPDIINAWCGKEATTAWQTKTRGRPHSAYANTLLRQYRIGVVQAAP